MNYQTQTTTLQTTIGDLVEAISQIALESAKTEQEGYKLAAAAVNEILKKRH